MKVAVTDSRNPKVAHDPTCETGRKYFSIPFRLDYVLRVQEQAGHPGVLDLGNWGGHTCAARIGLRT
jgi:hypothetical protein